MRALLYQLSYITVAPGEGFEPPTKWLTATRSTAELSRNESLSWRCPHLTRTGQHPLPRSRTLYSIGSTIQAPS